MSRRRSQDLLSILDVLASEKFVVIHELRLKQLLGYERMRENAWRDLYNNWKEINDENNIKNADFQVIWNESRREYILTVSDFNKNIESLI